MFLIITEPPSSPDNLTILSVTSRTARLSWSISRAEPKIERFVVEWKAQDGNTSCSFSLNNDRNHNGRMSYGRKKIIYFLFLSKLGARILLILCRSAGSWEVEAEEKTLYGQVEEAVLSSLRPATVYQVRVAAENELGRSKEGRVLQVMLVLERRGEFYLLSRFHLHLVASLAPQPTPNLFSPIYFKTMFLSISKLRKE